MIIPILQGFLSWNRAPITWVILALNVAVLIFCNSFGQASSDDLDELMQKDYFVDTQGRAYAQFLAEQSATKYPRYLLDIADNVLEGDSTRVSLLGQLAFRDQSFIDEASVMKFKGDQIAINYWKSKLLWSKQLEESHPSFVLGLSSDDFSFAKWITYIFVHSGWLHLIGNMILFLIFGAVLEQQIGGLALLVVFVLSGVFGAGVFAAMTGVTTSPLVGASGAVVGIVTLYCVLNWRKPMRFFYLFLPSPDYLGWVYFPAWVSFVIWFVVPDLAGYLASIPELGGVAHTAHIGGAIAGVVAGVTITLYRRWLGIPHHAAVEDETKPMGVLFPFFLPLTRDDRRKIIQAGLGS